MESISSASSPKTPKVGWHLLRTYRNERADHERIDQLKGISFFSANFYIGPLFALFYLADLIYYPAFSTEFLFYRLFTIVASMVASQFVIRSKNLFRTQIWCSIITLVCNASLHLMIYRIGKASTPYYAGLILTTMGMTIGYRYTWSFFWLNLGMCVVPFFGLSVIQSEDQWGLLSALFLLGVAVIGTVSRMFQEHLHKREFQSRLALDSEVKKRGEIIERKTKEALEMSALAKQFSPQVVEAIRRGELDISQPVHRSEVAVVFIDIVGSTERFLRLERDELHRVLSCFMQDTMESLLLHDLTIDKFLGDAVLGFSNDPIKHSDFIERAIKASLRVLEQIEKRRKEYEELWLAPFQVGIGIASGYANVGFYGDEKHVKNYTAIGRPVNLASRLAAMAKPGKILVSHECIKGLEKNGGAFLSELNVVDLGKASLRGFENDYIKVYELTHGGDTSIQLAGSEHKPICPLGHGELILDINQRGIFTYACSNCGFELENINALKEKKVA